MRTVCELKVEGLVELEEKEENIADWTDQMNRKQRMCNTIAEARTPARILRVYTHIVWTKVRTSVQKVGYSGYMSGYFGQKFRHPIRKFGYSGYRSG